MIRENNKENRLLWAQENMMMEFDNVIWTDETSIQLETHTRFCCRKLGQAAKPKPRYYYHSYCCNNNNYFFLYYRPKHPVKVHVWAGISKKGPTPICVFDGTMDAVLFVSILDRTLVPFLKSVFPDEPRYM